jgi:radical SAM superfamily enzyme YgiQ (UPF0313 family)
LDGRLSSKTVADVTLVNMNMLCVRYVDRSEREVHLPLGPLYLASAIEREGYAVDFRDYQLEDRADKFSPDVLGRFLADAADVLFVSCMANLLPFTLLALERYREAHPDAFIALGGVGAAGVEREVLALCPWIDAIGVGEGEVSGPALLRAVKRGRGASGRWDLSAVPGIVWREGDDLRAQPSPCRLHDLDATAPAWHLVDLPRYAGINVITSRGCPFPCSFCSVAPVWGRKPVLRSVEGIVAEMEQLHELAGCNLFLFQDEYFVSSPDRVHALCNAIVARGLPVRWKAFGRIDQTDDATMRAMAGAGCIELRYGVESGSDRVLSRVVKGFDAKRAHEVLSEAVGIFPGVDAFYMWGFPFETMQDFQQTLLHMIASRAMGGRILPSLLSLLPQTTLYQELDPSTQLEFFPELFPEYMLTGHEVCDAGRVRIADEHASIYAFIRQHPRTFPGFFHVDVEGNVLPKYRLLQKFGFYASQDRHELLGAEVECCGAHSP